MILDLEEFKNDYIKEAKEKGYTAEEVEEAFSLGFPFDIEWFINEGKVSERCYFLYECIYGMSKEDAELNLRLLRESGIPLEEYARPIDTRY